MPPITLSNIIQSGATAFDKAKLFYGHGIASAFDEAAYLALFALDIDPHDQIDLQSVTIDSDQQQRINDLYQQRIESRQPAAYITHEGWFVGLPFYVDERVLVPRSPIGELIINRFSPWVQDETSVKHILDIGTGSGCIAIACAHAFLGAQVDAVDISDDALAVTHINIKRFEMEDRVKAIQSDLMGNVGDQTYDIIVSNPPYVDELEMATLPDEYHHEPEMALYADKEGLVFALRILIKAVDHLNPKGIIIIEVGNSCEALDAAFPDIPFLWLEFEYGGHGVFLMTYDEVIQYQSAFIHYLS